MSTKLVQEPRQLQRSLAGASAPGASFALAIRHTASCVMAAADYRCIVERPNAAFRIQAARPAVGAVGDPLGWSASDSTTLGWDRRRLATAAVAYRGRHPLRVCSTEAFDSISFAGERTSDSRRAVDFPVDNKG